MSDYSIRPLESQFSKRTVKRIRAIQSSLERYPILDGAGRLFAREVISCLEAGLLLAALQVSASLFELYLRELLVVVAPFRSTVSGESVVSMIEDLDRQLEDNRDPQFGFKLMVNGLLKIGLLSNEQAEGFKDFYTAVRIPMHHGLTRRLATNLGYEWVLPGDKEFLEALTLGRITRGHELESDLETRALDLIEWLAKSITSIASCEPAPPSP
jgi:hypothetical protein